MTFHPGSHSAATIRADLTSSHHRKAGWCSSDTHLSIHRVLDSILREGKKQRERGREERKINETSQIYPENQLSACPRTISLSSNWSEADQVTTLPARKPGHMTWPLKQLMELEEQEMNLAPDVATEGSGGHLDQEGQQLEREGGTKAQKRGWGKKSAGTAR